MGSVGAAEPVWLRAALGSPVMCSTRIQTEQGPAHMRVSEVYTLSPRSAEA